MLELLNTKFPKVISNIIHNYTFFSGIESKSNNIVYTRDIVSKHHQEQYSDSHIIQLLEYENKIIIGDNHGYIAIFENDKLVDLIHDDTLSSYKIFISPNGDIMICSKSIDGYIYGYPILKFWRKKNKMSKYEIFINAISNPIKYYQTYYDNYTFIINSINMNTLHPYNMVSFKKNNDVILFDYQNKNEHIEHYLKICRNNSVVYTLRDQESLFKTFTILDNDNIVTGSNLGVIKFWRENICVATLKDITKNDIIKLQEFQNKYLLIMDICGFIYILVYNFGEYGILTTLILATLRHEYCSDAVLLPNNDFITMSAFSFKIWKKRLDNYTCILEKNHTGVLNIKPFETGFISWTDSNQRHNAGIISIWRHHKDYYVEEELIKKNIKNDIADVFVLSKNRLAVTYSNNIITILE